MSANELIEKLKKEPDIDSKTYDASYEIMRATIDAYSSIEDWNAVDYTDFDLIYLMAVGSFSDGLEKKKERVRNSHLPEEEKIKLLAVMDEVWERVCQKYYNNANVPEKFKNGGVWFGMFGTAVHTFSQYASDTWTAQIRELIKMLVDIRNMDNDVEIYDRAEKVLNHPIKGLQAATISIVLHCLKPETFPIINGNEGFGDCFEELGIALTHSKVAETYIGNCRKIKQFRDTYFHFKNYRVFDLAAKTLKSTDNNDLWPSKEEYPTVLTKEQWIDFLSEDRKTYPRTLKMLMYMKKNGGESTCKQIANGLGGHSIAYISRGANLGRRVKKAYNLPPCINEKGEEYLFAIPFQGHKLKYKDREQGRYSWVLRTELSEALAEIPFDELELEKEENEMNTYPLNTILYGPPGTGKTYNTVIYAVAIADKKDIEEVRALAEEDYYSVKSRFDELKNEGRIAFTTFHQSYGYEEFIEGIKPRMSEEDSESELEYSIEPGVFKAFCEKASIPAQEEKDYGFNKSPVVWKVSLAGTYENPVRDDCLKNDHIRIGWDSYGPDITEETNYTNGGRVVLNAFINKMKIGDVVVSCYSSTTTDAIGVVTGDYEWDDSYNEYKRIRKVKWLAKNIREDILEYNGGSAMVLSTVYQLKMTLSDVIRILNKVESGGDTTIIPNEDNYVFIIDEINRGNISKIFGELITLIEDTKRIGAEEEMTVKLPYSQNKLFGVPANVYILGTMNTADRSIALMDTALRRRFYFEEMMPDSSVISGLTITDGGESVDVAKMLDVINERIEYLYDREHTIGHAFFTSLLENPSLDGLSEVFRTKVVPLLQEYFYEDYEKIQLVLGDNYKSSDEYKFILDSKTDERTIFKGTPDLDLKEKKYTIQNEAFYKIQSYIEIVETR